MNLPIRNPPRHRRLPRTYLAALLRLRRLRLYERRQVAQILWFDMHSETEAHKLRAWAGRCRKRPDIAPQQLHGALAAVGFHGYALRIHVKAYRENALIVARSEKPFAGSRAA